MTTISKEVQNLLKKEGFISEIDLKEINLIELDDKTLESLLNKLNPKEKEATKKGSKTKDVFSMYRKENEFLKVNNGKFPDKKSQDLYKKIRSKSREKLMYIVSLPITKETKDIFSKFCQETYTNHVLQNPNFLETNFSALSSVKKLLVLNFVKKLNSLK